MDREPAKGGRNSSTLATMGTGCLGDDVLDDDGGAAGLASLKPAGCGRAGSGAWSTG